MIKTYRIVPLKRTGSCGMVAIADLNVCKPKFCVSKPSIEMLPDVGSTNLNKAAPIEDLPAPLRPTIPTKQYPYLLLPPSPILSSCLLACHMELLGF